MRWPTLTDLSQPCPGVDPSPAHLGPIVARALARADVVDVADIDPATAAARLSWLSCRRVAELFGAQAKQIDRSVSATRTWARAVLESDANLGALLTTCLVPRRRCRLTATWCAR
jgi:hypothetical protein